MTTHTEGIRIWDPLIRVFHWTLVVAFFSAYLIEDDWLGLHVLIGYTVLGLLLFRIIWGVIGTRHARFTDFVCSPARTLGYLKDALTCRARRYLGHNPAGSAMILAMIFSLAATTVTGLALYGYAEFSGPLAGLMGDVSGWPGDSLEDVHEFLADFTVMLVLLHIAGVVFSSLLHRENLVRSMFTGIKQKDLS
ncbi:MAG TPA: cytochrome b/b6 domain-containing protein [Gammaproteobacteria bacterium]|nr:cytochrome b/b6 domain-containing protein [Gammaproteobacteria bacterium]